MSGSLDETRRKEEMKQKKEMAMAQKKPRERKSKKIKKFLSKYRNDREVLERVARREDVFKLVVKQRAEDSSRLVQVQSVDCNQFQTYV